jgi:hypothetical protein
MGDERSESEMCLAEALRDIMDHSDDEWAVNIASDVLIGTGWSELFGDSGHEA